MAPETPIPPYGGLRPLPLLIFSSRWLQLPLYLGLIVAQGVYVILFLKELWHLFMQAFEITEQEIMLVVLGLIDVVMISNLLDHGDRRRLRDVRVAARTSRAIRTSPSGSATSMPACSRSSSRWRSSASRRSTCCAPSSMPARSAPRQAKYTETGVMWQTIIHACSFSRRSESPRWTGWASRSSPKQH